MTRETAFRERVSSWALSGEIADPPRWLVLHQIAQMFPEIAGEKLAGEERRRTSFTNVVIADGARELLQAFAAARIAAIPLKGIDVIHRLYGGRESDRRTNDIDILVAAGSAEKARRITESLGYRQQGEETKAAQARWSKDVTYRREDGVRAEIHHELMLDMWLTRSYEELSAAGLIEVGEGSEGWDRLTLEALAIYLLAHMAAHRFGTDSLRWVLDVCLLLDRFAGRLDRSRLAEAATRLGGRRAAGASVAALRRMIPAADSGPLDGLPLADWREHRALELIDPVACAVHGEAAWTKRSSVLCRMLLEPGPLSLGRFAVRKLLLGFSRTKKPD